jgi:DNA-binding Xre family transcriptional regulator
MAIKWTLKNYLANQHGIYRVTELQKFIVKKRSVLISYSNLSRYVRQCPQAIRLETLEIICQALDCSLSDFMEITPSNAPKKKDVKKLKPQTAPRKYASAGSFPDPEDYEPI